MSIQSIVHVFNNWCYNSPALSVLRDTKFGIPGVQTVHLVGITIVLGTTVVMNLRLLNLGYSELAVSTFIPQVWRWFRRGLFLTLAAGFVVFLPDPVRYAQSWSFRIKMITLALAIAYQFTIFRKTVHAGAEPRSARTLLISAGSLILWFGVGWCGRAIAFFG